MSTGKKLRPSDCPHWTIKSGPHSQYFYCTECTRRWEKHRDGHNGTTWEVMIEGIKLKEGGEKLNDDDVSQKSPKSQRLS